MQRQDDRMLEEFKALVELLYKFSTELSLLPLEDWAAAFSKDTPEDMVEIMSLVAVAIPVKKRILEIVATRRKPPQPETGENGGEVSVVSN